MATSMVARRRAAARARAQSRLNPFRIHEYAHGRVAEIPDPIEFIVSDKYLDRPNLYPRQATIIKIIFLRDDMFCADEQTEILTRRGWLPYWELVEGEDVMTISPETGLAEWAPADRVNVFPTHNERLIAMEGDGHSSLTTPNHRWLVDRLHTTRRTSRRERQFVETQDLIGARDRIACAAPVVNLPEQAKWVDAFVELAAWYWTEGHLRAGGGVVIAQSETANPDYVQRIRACLTTLFGPESPSLRGNVTGWRTSRDRGMVCFRLSTLAAAELRAVVVGQEKVPTPDFLTNLTQAQLHTFVETSIDADGSRYTLPSGKVKRDITQKSKARLDAFQMACSLAGVRTVLTMKPVRGSGPYAGREHWHLSLYDDRTYFTPQTRGRKFAITEVEHTGHVWCPTTKNGTWLARRNGKVYFTGNTQYDHDVIGEWEEQFIHTGYQGISPGVLDRIAINKAAGRPWFRETLAVMGRRGGKGYLGGLGGSFVTWTYMHRPGGPQQYYGIDRDKRLTGIVFAGKKEQARDNLWRDWFNVITGAPCFAPYISRPQAERLTIFAPTDVLKAERLANQGIVSENDLASFEIIPAPSTVMAARGPAMFAEMFDEQAHVISSTAAADAEAVYDAATPALDQFKLDGFIYAPSSPWRKTGKFYENWEFAIEMNPDGSPAYPERLMIQLPSWGPYEDWQEASRIPLRPPSKTVIEVQVEVPKRRLIGNQYVTYVDQETEVREALAPGPTFRALKGAVQEYDDQMRSLERANPETFKVERRCLDPDTRVLMADLTWRRIDDVEVGDLLVACDEFGAPGTERKMRTAVVEAKADSVDEAYRIKFDDGTAVVCSGRHRWLANTAGSRSNFRWRSILPQSQMGPRSVMRAGDQIRALVAPWEVDDSRMGGWLAGLYDGEGCITSRTRSRTEFRIDLSQNRGVVLDQALDYLHRLGFEPKRDSQGDRRPCQKYKITGLSECLRLLGQIRPIRLLQNGNPGMWDGRAFGHERGRRYAKTIVSITPVPIQRLVDLQTSTRTFVAEGLISHNSIWAESMDAYLSAQKVKEMFQPWMGQTLLVQKRGRLDHTYVAHGDPSNTNKRFGWSIAHRVWVPDEDPESKSPGMWHVVFDTINCWDPADFEDHIIDYDVPMGDIESMVKAFIPEDVSFDQFNVPATIGRLKKFVRESDLPKAVTVREVSRTRPLNWRHAELFKAALNMGLVHAPMLLDEIDPDSGEPKVNYASSEAELELKFLEEKNGAVVHPETGPVQTKDIADTIIECTVTLIGKQIAQFLGEEFTEAGLSGAAPTGTDPYRNSTGAKSSAFSEAMRAGSRGVRPAQGAARSRGSGMRRR